MRYLSVQSSQKKKLMLEETQALSDKGCRGKPRRATTRVNTIGRSSRPPAPADAPSPAQRARPPARAAADDGPDRIGPDRPRRGGAKD
jgi:hypothetical protein